MEIKIDDIEPEPQKIYLKSIGRDIITGIQFYKLNTVIPYEDWITVKEYFDYVEKDTLELHNGNTVYGWVTQTPETVEEILEIPEEQTLSYRRKKYTENYNKTHREEKATERKIQEIKKEFSLTEVPPGKHKPHGTYVDNPINPRNDYGGGEWFIINKKDKEIWYIINNSKEGDDYSKNNIKTSMHGAIGRKLPYDYSLARKILSMKII